MQFTHMNNKSTPLEVAMQIEDGMMTCHKIAKRLKLSRDTVYRYIRILAEQQYVHVDTACRPYQYTLTKYGIAYVSDKRQPDTAA